MINETEWNDFMNIRRHWVTNILLDAYVFINTFHSSNNTTSKAMVKLFEAAEQHDYLNSRLIQNLWLKNQQRKK